MYSGQQTKELQKITAELLKKSTALNAQAIEKLRGVLRFHEYRYYVMNDPLISDYEYDKLYKALEKIENGNPKLVTADSPTQRVAKGRVG